MGFINRFKSLFFIAFLFYANTTFSNIIRLTKIMCRGWGSQCCIRFQKQILKNGNVSTIEASNLISPFGHYSTDGNSVFNKKKSKKLFERFAKEFNELPNATVIQKGKSFCKCVYNTEKVCECGQEVKQYDTEDNI